MFCASDLKAAERGRAVGIYSHSSGVCHSMTLSLTSVSRFTRHTMAYPYKCARGSKQSRFANPRTYITAEEQNRCSGLGIMKSSLVLRLVSWRLHGACKYSLRSPSGRRKSADSRARLVWSGASARDVLSGESASSGPAKDVGSTSIQA